MFSRKNNLANLLVTISCLLILLWVYTATSKLTNFSKFERELANQTFSYTTLMAYPYYRTDRRLPIAIY
jgi:hypothetical protein